MRRKNMIRLLAVMAALTAGFLAWSGGSSSSGTAERSPAKLSVGPPPHVPVLQISVLDVGQGDGILIQAPNGKVVLIDSGPGVNQGLLLNQLNRLGVLQLDLMIETHPHEDHIGGFAAVLDKFTVRNFTDPGTTHTTATFQNLYAKLQEKQITPRVARKGHKYKLDNEVFLDILGPREPLIKNSDSDLNNNSVTARLSFQSFSMVFTGDAEEDAEERLVEDQIPPSTVLKLGHHGSRSSSSTAFLDMVKPKYSVLSCEVGNDYGHPHAETLKKLNERSINIYRTDQEGQVRFITDGRRLWIKTFSRNSLVNQAGPGDPEPTTAIGPVHLTESAMQVATPDVRLAAEKGLATPSAVADGPFWASKNSGVYHKPTCGNAKRIAEQNLVVYKSRAEAEAAGKQPAKDCKP